MAIAYGMVILVVYERSAHQDAFTRIEGLTVLVGGFPRNPELPHLGDQSCLDQPAAPLSPPTAQFVLRRVEMMCARSASRLNRQAFVDEFGDRRLELRPFRQDDRALDEVLQLPNVASRQFESTSRRQGNWSTRTRDQPTTHQPQKRR
jgi:hypothetical protein